MIFHIMKPCDGGINSDVVVVAVVVVDVGVVATVATVIEFEFIVNDVVAIL